MSFRDGDVVRYSSPGWARHGIAIVKSQENGHPVAYDTYWGDSPTDSSWINVDKLPADGILGNIHEFGPVPYPNEYEDFKDTDKYWIPMGGGSAYYRVRTGAEPDLARVYARLERAVEKAESSVRSAESSLRWAKQQLNEHINKHGYIHTSDPEAAQ
jgi:hypothetical protein